MSDPVSRLSAALEARYAIERKLGEGGMATVTDDPTLAVGQQDVLFSMADYLTSNGRPMYDVSPDDQRFVMLRVGAEGTDNTELILVENFFEELR